MSRPKQVRLMAVTLIASVTCCLISTGIFIHFATLSSPGAEERNKWPDSVGKESLEELFSLKERIKSLMEKIAFFEKEVALLQSSGEDMRKKMDTAQKEQDRLLHERNTLKHKVKENQKTYTVTALNEGESTRDRPATFVECTADGAIVQPSGKRFSLNLRPEEEAAFLSTVNQTRYVVFLIRPDGYEAFYRYRSLAISKNRTGSKPVDIGYEPVNAEWILLYPAQKG